MDAVQFFRRGFNAVSSGYSHYGINGTRANGPIISYFSGASEPNFNFPLMLRAVIPAVHTSRGTHTCSIQVITEQNAWSVTFPADEFRRVGRNIFIGENRFGKDGIS